MTPELMHANSFTEAGIGNTSCSGFIITNKLC